MITVARVDRVTRSKAKAAVNSSMKIINTTLASPPGRARRSTLVMNRPLTISWLGSSASTKEGAPMVKALIRVSWMGMKG